MSDQILRCVDGTQDVRHLDLKNVETGHTHSTRTHAGSDGTRLKGVCLLTGRSLDVLCSCLMLWLRVLCEETHHHRTVLIRAATWLLPR